MFSSVSTQKFEFLVDLTRNRKRQFYLISFPKLRQDVLFSGQKRRMNWSDLFTVKKWNENWGETADTFILQRMTLSGRSLIKHVQTWKHDSVVQHTQGELAIVCMDKHFVRNVLFKVQLCEMATKRREASKITTTISSTTVKRFVTSLILFWYSANSMMKLGANVQK